MFQINDPLNLGRFFYGELIEDFYELLSKPHKTSNGMINVDVKSIKPDECNGWYSDRYNSFRLMIRSQGLMIQHEINNGKTYTII